MPPLNSSVRLHMKLIAILLATMLVTNAYAADRCAQLHVGMSKATVERIMGIPKEVRQLGDPPVGVLWVYDGPNYGNVPLTTNGPTALELVDGKSGLILKAAHCEFAKRQPNHSPKRTR